MGLQFEEFQFEEGSIWPEEPALSASIIKRDQAIKQHKARGKGIGMCQLNGPNGLAPIAARRALSIELLQLRVMLVTGAEPHVDGLQLQKVPRMMRIKNMPRAPGLHYARMLRHHLLKSGSMSILGVHTPSIGTLVLLRSRCAVSVPFRNSSYFSGMTNLWGGECCG